MRFQAVLAVWRVCCFAFGDFRFVFVADGQQDGLGHVQIAFFLAVVFENMRFHNRIGGAGFFAEAAENALGQVDVVARGAAGAVFALFGFDVNRHGGADGLAQFAGDAAFFAVRIAALGVQAAKAHGLRGFFFGEVNRVFAGEEVFERYAHAFDEFAEQEGFN